jgi:hypothetical protein
MVFSRSLRILAKFFANQHNHKGRATSSRRRTWNNAVLETGILKRTLQMLLREKRVQQAKPTPPAPTL